MFSASLAPLILAGTIAYPSPLRSEEGAKWVGRTVVMVNSGTRFFRSNSEGLAVDVGLLIRTDYVVIRERGERIWVKQDGVEGWIIKEHAKLPEDAVEHFAKLVKGNPNDSALLARLSKAHELTGNLDAALKAYDDAIRIAPASSSWWNNRANLHQKKKDFTRTLDDYNRSIELSGTSAIVRGNRGNSYSHLRDYDKAIVDYNEALRLNPKYINALANRANAYREMGQYDKALTDYETALTIDPQFAFALSNRGELWLRRKELDKAAADIAAAVRVDLRSAQGFLHRGNLRKTQKRFDLALDDYAHCLWLEPRTTLAFVERGKLHAECEHFEQALKDFDGALKLEPKSPDALAAKAALLACCPRDNIRDGKSALDLAKQAVEYSKNKDGLALAALAAAHAELGNFEEAIAAQRQALSLKAYAEEEGATGRMRLERYEAKKVWRDK